MSLWPRVFLVRSVDACLCGCRVRRRTCVAWRFSEHRRSARPRWGINYSRPSTSPTRTTITVSVLLSCRLLIALIVGTGKRYAECVYLLFYLFEKFAGTKTLYITLKLGYRVWATFFTTDQSVLEYLENCKIWNQYRGTTATMDILDISMDISMDVYIHGKQAEWLTCVHAHTSSDRHQGSAAQLVSMLKTQWTRLLGRRYSR